jgi:hypothetical protein
MGNTNGSHPGTNGNGTPVALPESGLAAGSNSAAAIEYYILCPQRETEVPGLITHLISRDICDKRQSEHYHKCGNCVRSRIWREKNGLPVEEPAVSG